MREAIIGSFRSLLYRLGKLLGDIGAVSKGKNRQTEEAETKILMTPEGKKVRVNPSNDVCLYQAPQNPPNTGTAYTTGQDLYAYKARSGNWCFYVFYWSMWEGDNASFRLIPKDEARNFILKKAGLSGHTAMDRSEVEEAEKLFPGIFEEGA